jgi:hypothetical protein
MVGKEEITIIIKEAMGDVIDTNKIIDGKEMEIIIEAIITTITIIIWHKITLLDMKNKIEIDYIIDKIITEMKKDFR